MIQLIGAAVIALAIAVASFTAGVRVESDHRDALELAQKVAADKAIEVEQAKQTTAAANYEKDRANAAQQAQVITRTITKVVARPVYRNVCLDVDGLRLANAALTGKTADPAGPPAGVPGPKPAPGRNGGKRATGT